jgi:hypothetical protein
MLFSVSPLEKTDAQILYASGRDVPVTDTRGMEVGGNLRSIAVTQFQEINFG